MRFFGKKSRLSPGHFFRFFHTPQIRDWRVRPPGSDILTLRDRPKSPKIDKNDKIDHFLTPFWPLFGHSWTPISLRNPVGIGFFSDFAIFGGRFSRFSRFCTVSEVDFHYFYRFRTFLGRIYGQKVTYWTSRTGAYRNDWQKRGQRSPFRAPWRRNVPI